jgi:Flp pilus assembly protein TadD, contains TPR repeats
LKGIDLGRLNARERLFVERARALVAGRPKEAERLLDLYLTRHPDDPFALNIKGTLLWYSGKLDAAKTVFEHLVKIAPNWVVAYNQLGYIAMEQGRFARAEDYFKTYGFIAPDQANPHDSLGELLTLTGRYDQAVEELHRALAVKPDFCASYEHLVLVHSLMGDLEAAGRDIEQATASGGCPQKVIEGLKCSVTAWPLETTHRWRELLEAVTGNGCAARLDWRGSLLITVHRARAFTGDDAGADELERRVAADLARVEKDPAAGPEITGMLRAELGHMRGVRAAASGRYDDAAGRLREADRNLTYRGAGVGLFKLFNRLALAEVLAAGGHPVQAAAVVRAVREVNPAMAAAFGSGHWRPLGLREGSAARR